MRWVRFIPSHASFIAKSDNSSIFDKVADKNKMAPFYGSRCSIITIVVNFAFNEYDIHCIIHCHVGNKAAFHC